MNNKSVVPDKPVFLGWKYFCDLGDGVHAFCLLCASEEKEKSYKANNGMTEGLKKHLKAEHSQIWKEVEIDTKKRSEEKSSAEDEKKAKRLKLGIAPTNFSKQLSVKDLVSKLTNVDPSGAIQKKYDEALIEMISCNFLSFKLVESPEFHKLIQCLNPSINMKSRHFYSDFAGKYSKEIIEQVKNLIQEYTDASLAITTDIWSSRSQDSYISLTVHFVDKQFRLHRWTPAVTVFNQSHTGENIQQILEDLLVSKLHINLESWPLFATSDNASNMVKGIGLSALEMYACVNHTQQLAILDSFKIFKGELDDYTMLDASDKCKDLASYLHKSPLGNMMLENECQKSGHSFKVIHQANDTRWDSRCQNMEDVLHHEQCLLSLAGKGKLKVKPKDATAYSLVPSVEEFRLLKAAVKVLKVCKVTTKVMEQEKVPTVPLVIQRLYDMDQEIGALIVEDEDEVVTEFSKVLRQNIKNRFPMYGTNNELNSFGNYLNPCCKGVHLKLVSKFGATKDLLEHRLKEWKKDEDESVFEEEDEVSIHSPQKLSLSPTEMLRIQMKEKESSNSKGGGRKQASSIFEEQLSPLGKEMKSFELLPDENLGTDMLEWWKNHRDMFPLLSFLARVVFAVPAASSKSERVFSAAGSVLTCRRSQLNPDKVEDILTIKLNLSLLKEYGKWRK